MVATVIERSEELQQTFTELARKTGRSDADLLHEAISTYVRARRVLHPRSDGTIDAPDVTGRKIGEWVAVSWRLG